MVASRSRFGVIQAPAESNWISLGFLPPGRVGSSLIPTSGTTVSSGAYGGKQKAIGCRGHGLGEIQLTTGGEAR